MRRLPECGGMSARGTTTILWNRELDAKLRHYRLTRRFTWAQVAAKMGFCKATCRLRGIEIGLAPLPPAHRKPIPFNTTVDATILAMRERGATFRAIAATLGIDLSSVWNRHRELTRSVAGRAPVASQVRHGPDAWHLGMTHGAVQTDVSSRNDQTDGAPSRAPSSLGGDD
jgi:hypothetical protein